MCSEKEILQHKCRSFCDTITLSLLHMLTLSGQIFHFISTSLTTISSNTKTFLITFLFLWGRTIFVKIFRLRQMQPTHKYAENAVAAETHNPTGLDLCGDSFFACVCMLFSNKLWHDKSWVLANIFLGAATHVEGCTDASNAKIGVMKSGCRGKWSRCMVWTTNRAFMWLLSATNALFSCT